MINTDVMLKHKKKESLKKRKIQEKVHLIHSQYILVKNDTFLDMESKFNESQYAVSPGNGLFNLKSSCALSGWDSTTDVII